MTDTTRVSRQLVGTCCVAEGAQFGAWDNPEGWDGGRVDGRRKKEGIYVFR